MVVVIDRLGAGFLGPYGNTWPDASHCRHRRCYSVHAFHHHRHGVSSAQAADNHNGFFINGNVGQSNVDKGNYDDDDTAFGANIGYRWAVSPNVLLGVEGGYIDLGKVSPKSGGGALGEAEIDGWTVGVNGHFNVADNWYLSGRAGLFRADVKGGYFNGEVPVLVATELLSYGTLTGWWVVDSRLNHLLVWDAPLTSWPASFDGLQPGYYLVRHTIVWASNHVQVDYDHPTDYDCIGGSPARPLCTAYDGYIQVHAI